MEFGTWLPVVAMNPRFSNPSWEQEGGIDEIAKVAIAAEEAGFGFVCCAEHVALPAARESTRGGRYWDPLAVLGYVAAVTERIAVVPLVVVLPYHHPLDIAKRYGTLDRVAHGRMRLGVGVGSLSEEFEAIGADYESRGPRSDDTLKALRAIMGRRTASYESENFSFADMIIEPNLRADTEIWVGGRTRRSLRRALALGDAWAPFSLTAEQIAELLADEKIRAAMESRPIRIIPTPERDDLDPLGDPDGTRTAITSYMSCGASGHLPRFRYDTLDELVEQLQTFGEIAREETGRVANP